MALAAAVLGMGVSSCSEDRDPKYKAPTTYVLNTPAMQDQYIELTEGGSLELTSSQPDYGYSAITQYSAEMSLTEDFAKSYAMESKDKTLARMQVNASDVALGICQLSGIEDMEKYNELYGDGKYIKVYFRAVAQLADVAGSEIKSNVVAYNYIKPYYAVPTPGFIYLVGSPEGWAGPDAANAAHYADWRLFEADDAIGSHIYSGTFEMPAAPLFRFYTALTGWDADSYGSQEEDNPIEYPDFTSGSFSGVVVKGKGSFSFPNYQGGSMTVTVDMSDMKNITMTVVAN